MLARRNLQRATDMVQSFKRSAIDQLSEQPRRFSLYQLLHDCVINLHHQFKRSAINIEIDCPKTLELNSIPGLFSQLITNLLLNSHKHGFANGQQGGNITLQVAPVGEAVEIHYRDNGRGMGSEVLAHLFERFFTTARHDGGSGVGLHICYTIVVDYLQGEISCTSAPGAGVHFTITLPIPPVEPLAEVDR